MSSPLSSVPTDFEDSAPSLIRDGEDFSEDLSSLQLAMEMKDIPQEVTTDPEAEQAVRASKIEVVEEKASPMEALAADATNEEHEDQFPSPTVTTPNINDDLPEDSANIETLDGTRDPLDTTPSARSTRTRKPAERYTGEVETPKKSTVPTKRKSQPIRGNWTPDYLLSNPKSKLASGNLSDILANERAWTSLSRKQQLHLISLLPGASVPDDLPEDIPLPNLLKQALKSNLSFQADVRLFQEDLGAGRYEPQWIADAQAAMDKRAAGKFDTWKEENREEFWGQKQKMDMMALAGDSSVHTLPTLVGAGCFLVGDMWRLKVSRNGHVVEKEATITEISALNTLTFSFPPTQHKFSSLANGEDIRVSNVNTPHTLGTAILKEDARLEGVRTANSWKDFRCYRKNQDIGSPFDVRELFHLRNRTKKTIE